MNDRPWENEPDREELEHAGLPCLILRNTQLTGSLNGYVGVRPGHPLWGKGYDDVDLDVHGGLTFAGDGDGERWSSGYWWFGFDTGHGNMDYCPLIHERTGLPAWPGTTYKDIEYVRQEVKKLAEQLVAVRLLT